MKTKSTYENIDPILLAVDCIIFGVDGNKLRVLLFKREVEPSSGEWSLIGSFVKRSENIDEASKRILHSLTGLKDIYMEQLHCFGDKERDPGDRVVSMAYWSLINIANNNLEFNYQNHQSKWFSLDKIPALVLDHNEMVVKAISRLRQKAKFEPVAFELLPKEFTMKQLLNVYEAIFGKQIDDRNFRRRMIQKNVIKQLGRKDPSTSKKGSYLYALNPNFYRAMQGEFSL